MNVLKRCPFCGSEKISSFVEHGDQSLQHKFGVYCRNCRSSTANYKSSEEDAIDAWNTRHENICQNCQYWDKVEQQYDPRQYGECSKQVQFTQSHLTVEDFGCNKFKERT